MKMENVIGMADAMNASIDKLESLTYLMQEISEDFFRNFNPEEESDSWAIVYEYPKYGALFEILMLCIFDIRDTLKNVQTKEKTAEPETRSGQNQTV